MLQEILPYCNVQHRFCRTFKKARKKYNSISSLVNLAGVTGDIRAKPKCSLVCELSLCTHVEVIIVVSTKKMSTENLSRSSEDNQTLFKDDVDKILREEITQPSQGNDSLPNMLTSFNDNIVHIRNHF